MQKFLYIGILLLVNVSLSSAQTLTVVCTEPKGQTLLFKDGKMESSADGISGGTLSYSLDLKNQKATVLTQHSKSAGGSPISYEGKVIAISKRQLSVIVLFDKGIELHSLFPDLGLVFFTSHKDFTPDADAVSGKIFSAKCKFGSS